MPNYITAKENQKFHAEISFALWPQSVLSLAKGNTGPCSKKSAVGRECVHSSLDVECPANPALCRLAGQPHPQHTALVAFTLLYFQGQVQGPDGKVDCLGVHSSDLLRDME